MKILVVHNDSEIRHDIASFLEKEGHIVLSAKSGGEAISRYTKHRPELILMSIELEDMNGYRCTKTINGLVGNQFVPVVLLNKLGTQDSLDKFLESGAMDYIEDPYDHISLQAKIGGIERFQKLHAHTEMLQARSSHEVMLAKHMFDSVVRRSPKNISFLKHWSLSAGNFSGDMLIYEQSPQGDLYVLMADFTGHGLSAAIGALPTSDIFFAMTKKGIGISDIATEINRKLHDLLPVGHFCAATLLRLCPRKESIEVWIGGQPSIWLISDKPDTKDEIPSFHMPLGIFTKDEFSSDTKHYSLRNVNHLLLFSDGLIEAQSPHGHAFGEDGIHSALRRAVESSNHLLHQVKSDLMSFLGGLEPHDDVSFMSLSLSA